MLYRRFRKKSSKKRHTKKHTKKSHTKKRRRGGAPQSTTPTNLEKFVESPTGVDTISIRGKTQAAIQIHRPHKIYIAIGSAIHEPNDFSRYQTIPQFLSPADPTLVILYDDFSFPENQQFLRQSAANHPNWRFLVIQRNRTHEGSQNSHQILQNFATFLRTILDAIPPEIPTIICNYVAFRGDTTPMERAIYNGIHGHLKGIHRVGTTIYQWSYRSPYSVEPISGIGEAVRIGSPPPP